MMSFSKDVFERHSKMLVTSETIKINGNVIDRSDQRNEKTFRHSKKHLFFTSFYSLFVSVFTEESNQRNFIQINPEVVKVMTILRTVHTTHTHTTPINRAEINRKISVASECKQKKFIQIRHRL